MTITTFKTLAMTSVSISALFLAGGASAAAVSGAQPTKTDAPEVQEVIVTAAKGRAAEAAPVASSLKTGEPQAVITRKFIEEAAPRVGDYTTTAILAPSMATTPNPNGPGATDGAKITLRGFPTASSTSPTTASPGATPTARATTPTPSSRPRPSAAW